MPALMPDLPPGHGGTGRQHRGRARTGSLQRRQFSIRVDTYVTDCTGESTWHD